jgi:hypothetical protein
VNLVDISGKQKEYLKDKINDPLQQTVRTRTLETYTGVKN